MPDPPGNPPAEPPADADFLGALLHASRYQSRRSAKRLLHESGAESTGAALDGVLANLRTRSDWDAIQDHAEALEAARLDGVGRRRSRVLSNDLPRWLIGETPAVDATWIVHHCPKGRWSFVGQVVDTATLNLDEVESAMDGTPPPLDVPLDEGQRLIALTWTNGERPPAAELTRLMAEARRELRVYNAATDRDLSDARSGEGS